MSAVVPIAGAAGAGILHVVQVPPRPPRHAITNTHVEIDGAATAAGVEPRPIDRREVRPSQEGQSGRLVTRHDQILEEQRKVRLLRRREYEIQHHLQVLADIGLAHAGKSVPEAERTPDLADKGTDHEAPPPDAGREGNPEATIHRMEIVIHEATAPAHPPPLYQAAAEDARQVRNEARDALRHRQRVVRENTPERPVPPALNRAVKAYARAVDTIPMTDGMTVLPLFPDIVA